MMNRFSLLILLCAMGLRAHASGTLATFNTTVGPMVLELYDQDKPITVSNFIKYVTSGRFDNQIIQRWEPDFVIQGGGFTTGFATNGTPDFRTVPVFGTIPSELNVGQKYSNTYGTIAMARQGTLTNSASSQWFINITNNVSLDTNSGGYTVFGHLISGTNTLNLFATPTTIGRVKLNPYVNDYGEVIGMDTLPLIAQATNFYDLFNKIIRVDVKLRRDLGLHAIVNFRGEHLISWNSVAGVTNLVEFSNDHSLTNWSRLDTRIGTGELMSVIDPVRNEQRIYRIKLFY